MGSVRGMRRVAVWLTVASCVLAACGSDDDDSAESTSAESVSEETTPVNSTSAPAETVSEETTPPESTPAETTPAGTAPAEPTPGVSDDELVISVVMGFSGPSATVIESAYQGFETAVELVNEAGGINGRQLTVKKVDHKDTADGGVAACREVESNDSFIVAVLAGQVAVDAASECVDEAGIPNIYTTAVLNPDLESAFTYQPAYHTQGSNLAKYVAESDDGANKVGVIFTNVPAIEAMKQGFEEGAGEVGLEISELASVEPAQASFTPVLVGMQEAGVETLVVFGVAEAIGIWRDAAALGYEPAFYGGGHIFDFATTAARETALGNRGLSTVTGVASPAYVEYAEQMEARGRGRPRDKDGSAYILYGAAQLIIEMLERTGENPTRESFVAGVETIENFETGILPPMTYGPGDHVGTESVFPAICCNEEDFTWITEPDAITFN